MTPEDRHQKRQFDFYDDTWNPYVGCSRLSEGCRHCLAITSVKVNAKILGITDAERPHRIEKRVARMRDNYGLQHSKIIYACYMSDPFHEDIPDHEVAEMFEIMIQFPHVKWIVTTRRARRMHQLFENFPFRIPNLWLGVSIEMAKYKERLDLLLDTYTAGHRILMLQPLLEPIDLNRLFGGSKAAIRKIHWIIAGGNIIQGISTRETPAEWLRPIRDFCKHHGKPFLLNKFKNIPMTSAYFLDGRMHWAFPRAMNAGPKLINPTLQNKE